MKVGTIRNKGKGNLLIEIEIAIESSLIMEALFFPFPLSKMNQW